MAAILDVESIKLNTKLGNCKLFISAQLQNDKLDIAAKNAMKYLIWHVLRSEAFNKDSGFSDKSEYNDALSVHMIKTGKSVLDVCFSDVEITTDGYEKPDPIAKLVKQYVDLGFSEADAQAMAKQVQEKLAAQAKSEKPAKTADSVEA